MGSGRPNVTCQNPTDFYDTIYDAVYAALVTQTGVGAVGFNSVVAFNRPANAIAYSSGDWVSQSTTAGTGFTFVLPVTATQYVEIEEIRLIINASSVPVGMGNFRLWFYSNSQTFNDNTASNISYATEIDIGLGTALLGPPNAYGSSLITDPGSISFYTQSNITIGLVTESAWTPASGTSFALHLQGRVF